jgi:modulator of FtsH protease HflC
MSLAKNKLTLIITSFFVFALIIIYNSVYIVPEGQILIHPNSLQNEKQLNTSLLLGPGLHIKFPFLKQPTAIDMRLQSFSQKSSVLTADKQVLLLNYYAKWQVVDPAAYYRKTQNDIQNIQRQLTQTLSPLIEKQCAHNVLNTINNNPSLVNTLLAQANLQAKTLGITLVDIGFTTIDFPKETETLLLKNMRDKQTQLALEQHAIAKAMAENIRNKADNQANLLLAKAKEEAAMIRGQGDAEAAKIYSAAYHKNPQFAAFYLNLEAYRKAFTQAPTTNNFLVLNNKANFFNPIKGETHAAKDES